MNSHLDDERMSAHLDGEDPAAAGHLEECEPCRARVRALQDVAAAVASPVTVNAARRDAAVAAALRAVPAPPGRLVAQLRRRGAAIAAAAAAVLAVAGVAGVVTRDGGETAGVPTADRARGGEVARLSKERAGAAGGAADQSGAPLVEGGDLGDQSDPATLTALVETALAEPARPGAPTAEFSPGAPMAAEGAGEGAAAAPSPPPCVAEARSLGGDALGSLVYRAIARWQGQPSVVLAFAARAADGRPVVYVMGLQNCRALARPA